MNPCLLRSLLAALPVLGLALEGKSGLEVGGVGAGVFVLAAFFFFIFHPVIPRVLHPLSFYLLVGFLGVMGIEFFRGKAAVSAAPLLVGLSLLVDPDFFKLRRNWPRRVQSTLLGALFFCGILTAHGLLFELMGKKPGLLFFQMPAGSYALMGFALTFFSGRTGK